MASKVLVTGASSPLGRYFVQRLLEDRPEFEIVATFASSKPALNHPRVSWIQLDFRTDEIEIVASSLGPVDVLIHLAALTPGNNKSSEPGVYYRVNVDGMSRFICSLKFRGQPRVFYLSSSAVYNRTKGKVLSELSEKSLDDAYGLSKLMFEHEIASMHDLSGILSLGLRVPVLLTAGVKHNFLSKWKDAILNGDQIMIANPDEPFNAVCADFILFDAYKAWLSSPQDAAIVSNIFATTHTTLGDILAAVGYQNWKEVAPKAPAQIITTMHPRQYFPDFNALEVVRAFLA